MGQGNVVIPIFKKDAPNQDLLAYQKSLLPNIDLQYSEFQSDFNGISMLMR
jgi:hypothetical protein